MYYLWEVQIFFASYRILTDSRTSQRIAVFPRSFARIMYKAANQFSEVAWYICEQCLSKLIGKKLELHTYARRRPETYSFVGLIMRWLYGVVHTRVRVTRLGTFVIRFIMQLSADTPCTHGGINAIRSAHSMMRFLCNVQETYLFVHVTI